MSELKFSEQNLLTTPEYYSSVKVCRNMCQDRHGDIKDVDAYLHPLQRAQLTTDYF